MFYLDVQKSCILQIFGSTASKRLLAPVCRTLAAVYLTDGAAFSFC